MKKNYIAPAMNVTEVEVSNMIATSLQVSNKTTVNTKTEGAQLGKEQQGSWGNIWNN